MSSPERTVVMVTGGSGLVGKAIQEVIEAEEGTLNERLSLIHI